MGTIRGREMSKESQTLRELRFRGWITPQRAIHLHKNYRLASSINRLREKGWRIKTNIIRGHGVDGEYRYAKYVLTNKRRVKE